VRWLLAGLSLEQKVGQLFMLGFDGTTVTPANRALIHDLHLGGVTLFGRNIEDAQQLTQLNHQLQPLADGVPLFISIDQEGGLVMRVTRGATIFPGNMALGATRDVGLARRVAQAQADELLAMGVNMNLAPVVDVNSNPANPVIGVRAFGSEPELVSQMGVATIEGFQAAGLSAVAKHFPGHGDTAVDSHLDLPRVESLELEPFRAAIQAGVDGVMLGHLVVPGDDRAATLSRAVVMGLLRQELGYDGLILTDALDMRAITRDRSVGEAAVEAFEAGADLLLVAGITDEDRALLAEAPRLLLAAVQSGRISEERLEASVLRVLETKRRRGTLGGEGAGRPLVGHGELALEVARRAITLMRDDANVLPLRPEQKVLVVVPDAPTRSLVQDDTLPNTLEQAVQRFAPCVSDASAADVIVLGMYDTLQESLLETGKAVVGVALRGPHVAASVPTVVAAYGDRPVHLQAAAEALFGQFTPTGKVP
jgi:beta-N-acetylhexosaminidase